MKNTKTLLSDKQQKSLLGVLETRFRNHPTRHKGIDWAKVQARLESYPAKMWSLSEMERTGGEPDVVGVDKKSGEYLFYDCSKETPKWRCSVCYDRKGWESRKENRPGGNALDLAAEMGIKLLNEAEYRALQKLGEFDTKTSSWLETPSDIRTLGGAIFGDFRYGTVFIYHNGAQSYYAVRGFRGCLRV